MSEHLVRPLEEIACPLCRADERRVVVDIDRDYEFATLIDAEYAERRFQMTACERCGLVYLCPRPDQQEILAYYPDDAYCCFTRCPPSGRIMGALYALMKRRKRREILPLHAPDGVLVDFGCGNGHWLVALSQGANEEQRLIGFDPSASQVERLRSLGVEAYVGDEDALADVLGPASVDLILMIHVIEHLPDPAHALQQLATVLKPGGLIHGATPNVDAWDARLFGKFWAGWHPPRHLVMFDCEVLGRFATDAGLEVERCSYEIEGATHWAVSMHTVIVEKWWPLRSGQYRLPIYPLLLLAAIPIAVVQKLLHRTSVMSFVLRKPVSDAPGPG